MQAHFEIEELSDETSEERSYSSCETGVQPVSVPYLKNKKLRSPPPDIGTSSESLNDDDNEQEMHGTTTNDNLILRMSSDNTLVASPDAPVHHVD
jgi:hypothetical protein